jgi:signal transduction histidine kinase
MLHLDFERALPIVLWHRDYQPARWFAIAFSLGLLIETARQLANLGVLPWAGAMNFSLAGYLLAAPFILVGMIEQTRRMSEQLALAEQLQQAKSAFLARVSHELRSPLNTILGFARMLRRGSARLPLPEGTAGIEKGALRLLDLIDELLDESRAAAGKLAVSPAPTLFSPWLDEVSGGARIVCEAQTNRFNCARSGALPVAISVDGQRLRQVLENLLNNANRHTRQGEIRFECTAQIEGGTAILDFAVRDNGEGMTPAQQRVEL